MIEVAVILSGVVGTGRIFGIISFCFFANAVVGFWRNARRATPSTL